MRKIKSDNNKYLYIISLCIFIVLVFSITSTYLLVYRESRGNVNIIDSYYEIIFSNVTTSDELKVKLNGNIINVEIDDISTPKVFYVDFTNIGNKNVIVDGVYISNVSNNDISKNINIETSVIKGDILKGGNQKKLKVQISYNGLNLENKSYKFSLNYLFKEVNL